jgi:hypothetical protein
MKSASVKKPKGLASPKGFGKKANPIPTADVAMPDAGMPMMKKGGKACKKACGGKVKKPC